METARVIRIRRNRLIALVFSVLITLLLTASLLWVHYSSDQTDNSPASQSTAVIVDQLSLYYPNRTFVQTATNMLEEAGYTVDYYSGEEITVDYFRNLAAQDYKIIVLRVHGATSPEMQSVALFTSEMYNESMYKTDQISLYLGRASYPNQSPDDPDYFAVTSKFVKQAMTGSFNKTTIIMMGCYGLEYPNMADAFMDKGANAYISWNGSVSADHTDGATITLLRHLILDRQEIEQAVENTMLEKGADPTDKSVLIYFPPGAGQLIIQDIGPTANTADN